MLASAFGGCPYMAAQLEKRDLDARGDKGHGKDHGKDKETDPKRLPGDDGFLEQFYVDDSNTYMTTDTGTPVDDRHSLRVGERGPTVMEDFVMRTKIQRFDHERVPGKFQHGSKRTFIFGRM